MRLPMVTSRKIVARFASVAESGGRGTLVGDDIRSDLKSGVAIRDWRGDARLPTQRVGESRIFVEFAAPFEYVEHRKKFTNFGDIVDPKDR